GGFAPSLEPSAALEDRILASVAETLPARVEPERRRPSRWRRGAGLGAAAVLAAAAFGLGAMLAPDGAEAEVVHVVSEGDAWMRVEGERNAVAVFATMDGLPQRPAG